MQDNIYDVIIVGGGPAGLTAGIYAMRAAMNTLLIEKSTTGGQVINSDMVENWPGIKKIKGMELGEKMAEHAKSYGLEILNRQVQAIEPGLSFHTVHLDNGDRLDTCSIILATGGSPKKLGIPGEDELYGKGVSYCAVCDGFFFRNKVVVVVGGGDSALEESLYLAKIAKKVYLVHRRDQFRGGMILQKRVKAESKIEIVYNTIVTAIRDENGVVTGVELQDTLTGKERELATEGVFIFIGFQPNNELVPAGTRKNADGYVVTDYRCETVNPGIFVVGDLREKYAKQIITAAGDGCTAALAAAHYVEEKKASR